MGKVWMPGGGGGGTTSDELTATKGDVLKGKTAVTSDSDDEAITGTLELTGNAGDGDVLAGKGYYNTDPKTKRTGTMADKSGTTQSAAASLDSGNSRVQMTIPATGKYSTASKLYATYTAILDLIGLTAAKIAIGNTILGRAGTYKGLGDAAVGHVLKGKKFSTASLSNATGTMEDRGAPTQSLNCGGSYTINAGYYSGGKISANSLASQTGGATAEDKYVYSGKTYWKDGVKRTGSMTVPSLLSFSAAAYSTSQVVCSWKNPANGPFGGVIIRYKTGGYPTSVTDGSGYKGSGNNTAANGNSSTTIGGLTAGTTYYFRIWPYCDTGAGTIYGAYKDATCKVTSYGSQTFTASGTWTCPDGVRTITRAFLVGGGGGGGQGENKNNSSPRYGGGGGAGGYTATVTNVAVNPGQAYAVVVGAGGTGNANDNNGGTSSISGIASAAGGESCSGAWGVDGGSGSGAGGESGQYNGGGAGGSDGGNGGSGGGGDDVEGAKGGTGQGRTTRKFGESGNTLYSGAGGGGAGQPGVGGAGGAGGGGAGGNVLAAGVNGAANTGGGGGGGGVHYSSSTSPKGGSGGSGIVIIEW